MNNQKYILFQLSNSKIFRNLLLLFCAFGLILSSQSILFAQSSDTMLFKIIKRNYENTSGSEQILFIYESGRVDCGNSKQTTAKKARLQKTIKCFRISKDRISQLIKIAEQSDFLNASGSYRFFDGGTNSGSSATIIYYRENAEKIILLGTSPTIENETAIPVSLNNFLRKIHQIDEKMELDYELGKRLASN